MKNKKIFEIRIPNRLVRLNKKSFPDRFTYLLKNYLLAVPFLIVCSIIHYITLKDHNFLGFAINDEFLRIFISLGLCHLYLLIFLILNRIGGMRIFFYDEKIERYFIDTWPHVLRVENIQTVDVKHDKIKSDKIFKIIFYMNRNIQYELLLSNDEDLKKVKEYLYNAGIKITET